MTAAWLGAALAASLGGDVVQAVDTEPVGIGYGLSSRLLRCRIRGPSRVRSVVVKLWDIDGPAGGREVLFYRTFGTALGTRVPACYHAAVDEGRRRGVVVLEDLTPVVQGDCLESLPLPRARAVAESLAALHATWWEHTAIHETEWLLSHARSNRTPEWFAERRPVFLRRFGDRLDGFARSLVDGIGTLEARADERLGDAPQTLLHGDVHMDNVVFEGATRRPVLLDWARAARGPCALDLVDVVVALERPADRDALVAEYLARLAAGGVTGFDEEMLDRQLGGALLRRFASRTYGVARWDPKSDREARMIPFGLDQILAAIALWRERDPELFRL